MPRKGENIYKRKDGRWEGRCISSYDSNGKVKYKYVYAKSYKEVKEKLFQIKAKSTPYSLPESLCDNSKYEYWLKEWLLKKEIIVKDSTYVRYRNMIYNHIQPELGKYPISKISTALMEQFVNQKLKNGRLDDRGGISVKTMTDILVIIKESFRYAQGSGASTICNFERICIKKSSHEMRVLSNSEEQRLLSVLLSDLDQYKLGVYLCLFTGIRVGELCALKWKNISFADKTLKIESTMQRLQFDDKYSIKKTRIIITEPKSYAALRIIPLPDFLLEKLKSFAGSPDTFVLSGESKEHIEPRTMQNKFKRYLSEGQVADANFHALRHTFATRCMEIGFDVKTLSEILGHSSVKITLDKYVHSSLALKRSNMEKLQKMVIGV